MLAWASRSNGWARHFVRGTVLPILAVLVRCSLTQVWHCLGVVGTAVGWTSETVAASDLTSQLGWPSAAS
jgi:hypothetical protein